MGRLARVRIFAAGEFAAPTGWPEDVGVAAILSDGIEVFPVHAREGGSEVLRRIAALTECDLRDVPVHPAVSGHPACDLSFSAVADLRLAVEDFLSRAPEAVEEADDFAVNFGFAVEEGIAFPALLASPVAPEAPVVPQHAGAPSGYVPVTAQPAMTRRHPRAVLRVDLDGGLMVLLDPDMPALSAASPPILLREDGLGLAVPAGDLPAQVGALRLVPGCLPWIPAGVEGEIPLLVMERDGFLFLSFLPEWAWSTPPVGSASGMAEDDGEAAEDADGLTAQGRLGRFWAAFEEPWRKRVVGLVALSVIMMGAGLGFEGLRDGRGASGAPPAAVDALRAGLFD